MTVITNKEQLLCCSRRTPETCCNFCDTVLDFPFLEWDGLFICGGCCVSHKSSLMADPTRYVGGVFIGSKRGLHADIIHGAAIAELQALGYGDETLVRSTLQQVEQAALAERLRMEPVVESRK